MKADLIVTGKIFTGVKSEKVEMMAVRDGKIIYMGNKEKSSDYQSEKTKLVSLETGCAMPGIVESHAHVTSGVPIFHGINLYEKEEEQDYLNAIDRYMEDHRTAQYVVGRGFINSHFGPKGPTSTYLDENYPETFFYLESEDCHSCLVSKNVIKRLGYNGKTKALDNGVIVLDQRTKEPTGWLKEKQMDPAKELFPSASVEDYKEAILKFQESALHFGITSVYEPMLDGGEGFGRKLTAYMELEKEEKLCLDFRIGLTVEPSDGEEKLREVLYWKQKVQSERLRIIGIKLFVDGVVEGHTAFLREDYADTPGDRGENMWDQAKLDHTVLFAIEENMNVHVHIIGDAAMDSILCSFDKAKSVFGNRDLRHSIAHLQIIQPDQIDRMKEHDLVAVLNSYWHFKNPAYFDEIEIPYLGKERAEKEYPGKSFSKKGIKTTLASDWPVSYTNNPFIGMEIAMTRKENGRVDMDPLNIEEALNIKELIETLTINGAWQIGTEELSGTLEEGKRANFVILDRDITATIPQELGETRVLGTYIDGKDQINTGKE